MSTEREKMGWVAVKKTGEDVGPQLPDLAGCFGRADRQAFLLVDWRKAQDEGGGTA